MNYNKLTHEQERVIIHKATEAPLPMSMTIFMKIEHLFVEGVIRRSFRRRASLMPDVDGQASMKASQMQ